MKKTPVNPDNKVTRARASLAFIIRTPNIDVDAINRQLNLLNKFYDVDVFSFYAPPAALKHKIALFPPGTGVQTFLLQMSDKQYQLAYLYVDDNSNVYTMEQMLKKRGIKILSKNVVPLKEETKKENKEEVNDKQDDSTRQSFIF